jgi:hypothetical protein
MTIGRVDADQAGARPYLFLEHFLDSSAKLFSWGHVFE